MNDVLKQRLVGALILVALGVVFWPIIFVQPGEQAVEQQQRIPPRPGISTLPMAAPDEAGLRKSGEISARGENEIAEIPALKAAPKVAEKSSVDKAQAQPTAPPAPSTATAGDDGARVRSQSPEPLKVDNDGVPVAWVLQVISVSSKEKAETIRQRLQAMNYKASIKKVERDGKVLHRVYLGPKFERARLEALRSTIDAEFGVSSLVARYVP